MGRLGDAYLASRLQPYPPSRLTPVVVMSTLPLLNFVPKKRTRYVTYTFCCNVSLTPAQVSFGAMHLLSVGARKEHQSPALPPARVSQLFEYNEGAQPTKSNLGTRR